MAGRDPNLTVSLVRQRQAVESLLDDAAAYGPRAYYYLSGAQAMADGLKTRLKANGIPGKRIIVDPFLGY